MGYFQTAEDLYEELVLGYTETSTVERKFNI